ncbi:hypothetical protein F5Y17DRAFT_422470 [Xylariaceae sp. FL0594]|nr:hypothetical protein F5Y17DRAFT_422470 [Xylariaceae sp. FL0594]
MTEYVEARSLTALNQLASNPPQYPKKPNETRQDALTLYISRVPGTRDIILSTMKPQLKNVTAEDVASSLYYVHLQTPEDEVLLSPTQSWKTSSPRSSGEGPRTQPHIQRKPLPVTAVDVPPAGKENVNLGVPARKPVPGSATPTGLPPDYRLSTSPPYTRSVLGNTRPLVVEPAQSSNVPRAPLHELNRIEEQQPPLPPRHGNGPAHADIAVTTRVALPNKKRPFTPFSLTLIRREPTSGQQWNVGKIASFQLEDPDSVDDGKYSQHSPSIQIHLETSGYAKFRGLPVGSETTLGTSLDLRPGSASSANNLHVPGLLTGSSPSGAFERQVKMVYTPSFTATLKNRLRRRSSLDEDRSISPVKRPGHGRHASQASIGSFGGDFDGSDAPVITHPAPGLKPRGYMFYSPWNGRCEFVTGNAGRSLRCRHILPTYGGYNPLVESNDGEHGDEKKMNNEPTISELRFNLPRNDILSDTRSPEGGMRTRDHISNKFNKMVAKAQGLGGSDEEEEEAQFHLGLGREHAGGGNRGKRAKMGKLIIYEEGLKMLDLVVAANVGIWWATWERTC